MATVAGILASTGLKARNFWAIGSGEVRNSQQGELKRWFVVAGFGPLIDAGKEAKTDPGLLGISTAQHHDRIGVPGAGSVSKRVNSVLRCDRISAECGIYIYENDNIDLLLADRGADCHGMHRR